MAPRAKVLVVDDEPMVRSYLEKVLTHDGHQVVATDSGEAALERITVEEFDLALVDLKMNGIGGLEVLATLRQQSPAMAVIMLTAHASLETAVEALRQGAHDYLFKPCRAVALRESVRTALLKRQHALQQQEMLHRLQSTLTSSLENVQAAVLGQMDASPSVIVEPAEEQARFLQWGDLIIDFMRHVITLDGNLLELSPTEFDLLAYLASEAPRVVSAQELVREVQGYESEPWEARDVVRYHIYRIRYKIKAATGRTDVIRTMRGVGYTVEGAGSGLQL